jgi:hypothetical protein
VKTTDRLSGRPATRETNTMPQWAGSCWLVIGRILNDFVLLVIPEPLSHGFVAKSSSFVVLILDFYASDTNENKV